VPVKKIRKSVGILATIWQKFCGLLFGPPCILKRMSSTPLRYVSSLRLESSARGVKMQSLFANTYYIDTTMCRRKTALYRTVNGDPALLRTSKTAKMIKVILLRALWQNVNVLLSVITFIILGGAENSGPENDGQKLLQNTRPENDGSKKSQSLKMQDLQITDHIAWLENAGPENAGPGHLTACK